MPTVSISIDDAVLTAMKSKASHAGRKVSKEFELAAQAHLRTGNKRGKTIRKGSRI